jgi:hypothetical protein
VPFLCIDISGVVLFTCTYYESKNKPIPIKVPMHHAASGNIQK